MPAGRPSKYTQSLATELCKKLARGESLRTACKDKKMPDAATVFAWMHKHPEFLKQYEEAKHEAADALAEEILDIADDATNDWMEVETSKGTKMVLNTEHVQRSRLRIDTRKWIMAKMKPKRYGEKVDVTTNGKDLPTPIMALNAIPQNNSDAEDNQPH